MPNNTAVSPAKMPEPIEMLFGLWIRVGPRKDYRVECRISCKAKTKHNINTLCMLKDKLHLFDLLWICCGLVADLLWTSCIYPSRHKRHWKARMMVTVYIICHAFRIYRGWLCFAADQQHVSRLSSSRACFGIQNHASRINGIGNGRK